MVKPIIRLWGHNRGRSPGFVSPQIQQTGIFLRLTQSADSHSVNNPSDKNYLNYRLN